VIRGVRISQKARSETRSAEAPLAVEARAAPRRPRLRGVAVFAFCWCSSSRATGSGFSTAAHRSHWNDQPSIWTRLDGDPDRRRRQIKP